MKTNEYIILKGDNYVKKDYQFTSGLDYDT
jgi:hypothetical protein